MASFFLLFNLSVVNAQNYVPLAPLPGLVADQPVSMENYLGVMFKIGIGLAGVFAVLMIVISGIQFIGGASSPSARTEANERITHAILGLILALGSWLILNTINPGLLKTKLEIDPITVTGSGSTSITIIAPQWCVESEPSQKTCFENKSSCLLAEQNLQSAGITITQNCPNSIGNVQTRAGSCGDDGGVCVEGVPKPLLPGLYCPDNSSWDIGGEDCQNEGYVCCR